MPPACSFLQVVQRLQRHNQQNVFKKTVLDMMANELLSRHLARIREAEAAEQQHQQQAAQGPAEGGTPGAIAVLQGAEGAGGAAPPAGAPLAAGMESESPAATAASEAMQRPEEAQQLGAAHPFSAAAMDLPGFCTAADHSQSDLTRSPAGLRWVGTGGHHPQAVFCHCDSKGLLLCTARPPPRCVL